MKSEGAIRSEIIPYITVVYPRMFTFRFKASAIRVVGPTRARTWTAVEAEQMRHHILEDLSTLLRHEVRLLHGARRTASCAVIGRPWSAERSGRDGWSR